jgi:serine/threonine-protein kinase
VLHELVPIIAILSVFGIPGYLALKALEYRHQRKLREADAKSAPPAELEAMKRERKLLVGRIENLETIVCSVDYELNQKLNRLVLETSEARALPAAPSGDAATAAAPAKAGVESTAFDPASPKHQGGDRIGSATPELEIGANLAGRYRVQRLLGRGGMGAVYLADDQALGEPVALKVVSSALALEPDQASERFRREAQAARRIAHPNVIRIHDLGEAGTLLYISMEYFPGKTLARLLEARGALTEEDYRDFLGQICDGLAAAHAAGVVHRDLKPGNVLVGERNAVKLIDFGLATSALMKGLTATGQMLGTPSYMSPEQVKGLPVDARSDIYSLGALAYHMVVGRPPFDGPSPIAVGFAHLMEPVPNVAAARPGISAALADAVGHMLAKDPAARPQTVAEVRKLLLS